MQLNPCTLKTNHSAGAGGALIVEEHHEMYGWAELLLQSALNQTEGHHMHFIIHIIP